MKPHLPTLAWAVIILLLAIVIYHFVLGRKG
jgi:hypothetical protein